MAPRPPPLPRPRPRGVRPRPPRLPRPPRPLPDPLGSGVFGKSSLGGVLSSIAFSSGVSPDENVPEEFLRLLDNGVVHTEGILSRASVIRGNFILELIGSMSGAGRSSAGSSEAVSTIVTGSGSAGGVTSGRRPPRPRPRPPRGF